MRVRSWMMLCGGAILLLSGCVGESSAEAYTGVWSWDNGSSVVLNCESDSFSDTFSGNESFIRGSSSDLVLSGGCNYKFDVAGDTASLVGSQSCDGGEYTEHWTSWTFNRSGDSMTVSGSGSIEYDSGLECVTTINGAMTRVGS